MDKNIDWSKILRFLSGECTIEEELELTEWMESDTVNDGFIQFLQTIWQMEPGKKKKIDAESAWERFSERYDFDREPGFTVPNLADTRTQRKPIGEKHKKRKSIHWFGLAGVAVSMVVAVLISLQFIDNTDAVEELSSVDESEYRELKTEKGQRTRVILSDGSIIHLNSDSYLRIPKAFVSDEDRRVYLEGEAFFEITRNENITFQVVAAETVTTVLGTSFNVRSYSDEADVTVVVADGRVSLGYLNDVVYQPAVLTKRQKGVIRMGESPVISDISDLSVYHGWIEGDLVFEQEPLPKMISKLERWFGIDIEANGMEAGVFQKRLTASYSERQPIEDVLQSISLVLDLSFEQSDTSSNSYKLYNKQ